eukprot:TRINITY_DN111_c1_g1_i1.p1 TRINITY_DN111_c1_g1~~TRINITY_DN111_c1_g1_i1.p1  ORF type:complete len:334 (-),score=100.17 TRINITY_DN111_c1_g1_i1:118-1119(-)
MFPVSDFLIIVRKIFVLLSILLLFSGKLSFIELVICCLITISITLLNKIYYHFTKRQVSGAILITGASTGIGKDAAIRLARLGYTVFAGVRNGKDVTQLCASAATDNLIPVFLDVTKPDHIQVAFETVKKRLESNLKLEAIVNNAGIAYYSPLELSDSQKFKTQFDINFFGCCELIKKFLPLLRESKGRIINIASVVGQVSLQNGSPYCGSKFALEAMSDSLRLEVGKFGIDVVVIEPGAIKTEIIKKVMDSFKEAKEHPMAPHYEKLLNGADKMIEIADKNAAKVSKVSDVIEVAIRSKKPRTRYRVGYDAALLLSISFINDRIFDFLKLLS